ncbi:MAG: AAA family ATPase, partial [Jiangellales bacterium]
PFMVKGKTRPVTAYLVEDETGTRPPRGLGSLPFLGRDTELATLTTAITNLTDGYGGVLTLLGDAGMGKTRLLREALTTADVPVIAARAEPYGAATPYRPVRDPLRDLLGLSVGPKDGLAQTLVLAINRLAPDLTPWAPLLGDVLGIPLDPTTATRDLDPQYRPDRTADAVIHLIHATTPGPLIVAFDDTHYSDDATSLLATRLERETADRPWLFLVARRDEEAGYRPISGVTLEVGPLAHETVQDLVYHATAAAPLRPHTVEAVATRVAGNPLFLEETLRNLREHGDIDALPTSLEGMVAAQIDALSPLARRVVRRASVLGRSFRTPILRDLFTDDPDIALDDATLKELADILEPDGNARLRFRHALLRDAAYDSLPFVQRRELHLAAAAATLRRGGNDPAASADSLALHYTMGGDMASTWTWARVAGDRARGTYAYPVAALQYRRALRASDRLDDVPADEVLALWLSLGDVSEIAGDFPGALDAYRKALRWTPTAEVRARVLLRRARAYERLARYRAALGDLTRAEHQLLSSPSQVALRLAAEVKASRAAVLLQQDRFSAALAVADAAEKQARVVGAREALALALERKEIALQMLGRPSGGVHARESLELYRELDDLDAQQRVINNLGAFDFYAGNWVSALAEYTRAAEITRRLGNDVEAAISDSNRGEILVLQGRYAEAGPILEATSRVLRAADFMDGATFSDVQLARVRLAQGDVADAKVLLDSVIDELTSSGKFDSALEAAIARAQVSLAEADPSGANLILDSSLDVARHEAQVLLPQLARVRAEALFALGDAASAARSCAEGIHEARALGLDYELAKLSLLASQHAVTTDVQGALPDDEAVATLRSLGVTTA